jgi:hypothetical protein
MAERKCGDCRYFDLSFDDQPCKSCWGASHYLEWHRPGWVDAKSLVRSTPEPEPEPDEKLCSTCKHGDKQDAEQPCRDCIEAEEDHALWEPVTTTDPINPGHYTRGEIQLIQLIRHLTYNRGAAVKYLVRAGVKDPVKELEDLQKALWYVQDEIQRLTGVGDHAP